MSRASVRGSARVFLVVGGVLALAVLAVLLRANQGDGHTHGLLARSGPTVYPVDVGTESDIRSYSDRSRVRSDEGPVREIQVSVIDPDSVPIQGAMIYAGGAEAVVLGRTSPDGTVVISSALLSQGVVTAVASGYATLEQAIGMPVPDATVLTLVPESTIAGRVVTIGGDGLPGATVLAWSSEYARADGEAGVRALAGDARLPIATSGSDGSFEIRGLDPSRSYIVAAGGRGLANSEPVSVAQLPATEVVITLVPIFGALIRRMDAEGKAIHVAEGYHWEGASIARDGIGAARAIQPRSIGVALAGLDLPARTHPSETVHLFMSNQNVDAIGPLHATEDIPGYEPANFEFLALRAVDGEVPVYECVFEPYVEGFGALHLELVGADDWHLQPQGRLATWATLSLVDQEFGDPARPVSFNIPEFRGSYTLEDIPFGEYLVRFGLRDSDFVHPEHGSDNRLVRVSGSPSKVVIDVGRLGAVEFDVFNADGSAHAGQFRVIIGENAGFDDDGKLKITLMGGAIGFRRAPYIVSGLTEGQYTAYVTTPYFSGDVPQAVTVFVESSSSTSVAIWLPQ